MDRSVKRCLQFALKVVNAAIGILGIAMILYGVWMIRVWQRDMDDSSSDDDDDYDSTLPWFIHAFLGIGVALCAITFLGHIAANTANTCYLGCYSGIIFLLILFDSALIADVLLNSEWEKDLPDDPSGRLDDFKDFVHSNMHICQWVALLIFLAQGCSILIATIIRTLAADEMDTYGSDDEAHDEPRIPLFTQPAAAQTVPTYVVGEPYMLYDNNEECKVNCLCKSLYFIDHENRGVGGEFVI
ncbi:hypothetical protein ACH5RR_015089 [Cinchona calisaya]|uniref:Tetraspanin n=1 Tax=Cinchona calisaya TaxID=153742 RepID=A0ABD2ZVL4_9GENT